MGRNEVDTMAAGFPMRGMQHHRTFGERVVPILPAWACYALSWVVAVLLRQLWREMPTVIWVSIGVGAITVALTVMTYLHSGSRNRIHATATVAAAGAWLTTILPVGWDSTLCSAWGLIGAGIAVSWNIKTVLPASRREKGSDQEGELFKAVKLAGTRALDVAVAPNKAVASLQLPAGQLTADDVASRRGNIASGLAVPANAVRVRPDPERHDRVTLTVVPRDMLKEGVVWPGPSSFGGSIADRIETGIYDDGQKMGFWFPGNRDTGRQAMHLLVMGMNGAGKSAGGQIAWTEMLTRRDVLLWGCDPIKGAQTFGRFASHMDWCATTDADSKAMVRSIMPVVRARADQLGKWGFDQWTPDVFTQHGMPYLVIWVEEASMLLRDSDEVIDIVQTARSAGVSFVPSLQRPSHDNLPATARAQMGSTWCFGVKDINDATFAVDDDLVEQGIRPDLWKNFRPGYCYLVAAGVDEEAWVSPCRTYNTRVSDGAVDMVEVLDASRHLRASADPITAKAAGKPYANRDRHIDEQEATVMHPTTTPSTGVDGFADEHTVLDADALDADVDEVSATETDEDLAAMVQQGLDGQLTAADDRREIPMPDDDEILDVDDEDLDAELSPAPVEELFAWPARKPSTTEALGLLVDVLREIERRGADTVGPRDIPRVFFDRVRARSWVSPQMSQLALMGFLAETREAGRYRFGDTTIDPTAAGPSAHAA